MNTPKYDRQAIFADIRAGMTYTEVSKKYGIEYGYLAHMCVRNHVVPDHVKPPEYKWAAKDPAFISRFELEWPIVTEYVLHGLKRRAGLL